MTPGQIEQMRAQLKESAEAVGSSWHADDFPDKAPDADHLDWENWHFVRVANIARTLLDALEVAQREMWPEKLTPELTDVLSLGCAPWNMVSIAEGLRQRGHAIAHKMEAEHAYILHLFSGIALKHGEKWREVAVETFKTIPTIAAEQAAQPKDPSP
jgi:hypothetical protein